MWEAVRTCGADIPVREAKPNAVAQPKPVAPQEATQQNVSMESATAEPAAERRKNAAHGASRGTEPANSPAPKERKNPGRDLQEKEIERVQAAIDGAERGNWRDLRTVFEFAGISEPNKEAPR